MNRYYFEIGTDFEGVELNLQKLIHYFYDDLKIMIPDFLNHLNDLENGIELEFENFEIYTFNGAINLIFYNAVETEDGTADLKYRIYF